jgi:hypothetical protein
LLNCHLVKLDKTGTGASTIITLEIRNVQISWKACAFVQDCVLVTSDIKDTSLLRNLSTFRKLCFLVEEQMEQIFR